MATTGTHIPTPGAVPDGAIKYFGDKFLETDDFFGRLPKNIIEYLAFRGINMPDLALFNAMYSSDIITGLKVPLREGFVNYMLKNATPEQQIRAKNILRKHDWVFDTDKPATPREQFYS